MKLQQILSHFNLEQNPFSKEISTDELIEIPALQQAEDQLKLLIETRGIGILTGHSGCGKTSILRSVASQLNPGLYKPVYICNTSLGPTEFYQVLAATLGIEPKGRRNILSAKIKKLINETNTQNKIHPVIFLDDAHALTGETLKELRHLTNFEYDSRNSFTLLLCGLPELIRKLSLNIYTELANSITFSIKVEPLKPEESCNYLENRIIKCGGQPNLFTNNAMKLIHDFSQGILRVTGTVAWRSIVKAAQMKQQQIEKEIVQLIIEP
jgi:general secretion pathway protein A